MISPVATLPGGRGSGVAGATHLGVSAGGKRRWGSELWGVVQGLVNVPKMGNLWEIYGETMGKLWEIYGKPWENHGKIMGNLWEIYGKTMEIYGKTMEIYGKTMENYGKTLGQLFDVPKVYGCWIARGVEACDCEASGFW